MDEIALRKGHQEYITVLVDLDRHVPVAFVNSRKHKDIKKVLYSWGFEVLDQIIEVSIDMSANYRNLVKKILPDATIVADRFHVMKLVGDELNQAIIKEKKAVKLVADPTEKERKESVLHRSKYAILKPEDNLTETQKLKLAEVKKSFPLLAEMHQQKEEFRKIFEESTNWADGTFRLLDWLSSVEANFEESTKTIKRWMSEIIGYFDHGTASGVVEGINNRLKLIKRLGYGFRNFENFSLRCLICWHLNIGSA
jgi:transposase